MSTFLSKKQTQSSVLRALKTRRNQEKGFALVELMITVVIIGILTSIGLIVFTTQQRVAHEASVQHDVDSNKSVMAPGSNGRLYKTADEFLAMAAITEGNEGYYTVSDDFQKACTHTIRVFGEDDSVAWRFRTEHGQIEQGLCEPYEGEEVDFDNGDTEGNPPIEDPDDGEVGSGGNNPPPTGGGGGGGGGSTTPAEGGGIYPIYPANADTIIATELTVNETGRACFVVTINTTSQSGAPWAFKVDKTDNPVIGNEIRSDGGDGRFIRVDNGDHYLITGSGALVNASQTISQVYGAGQSFCFQSPNGQAIQRPAVNSSIVATSDPTGTQWYATQRFTVTNNSLYHSEWQTEVDMTPLLNHMGITAAQARLAVQTAGDISINHVSGNTYRIHSNSGYWSIHKEKPLEILIQAGMQ